MMDEAMKMKNEHKKHVFPRHASTHSTRFSQRQHNNVVVVSVRWSVSRSDVLIPGSVPRHLRRQHLRRPTFADPTFVGLG